MHETAYIFRVCTSTQAAKCESPLYLRECSQPVHVRSVYRACMRGECVYCGCCLDAVIPTYITNIPRRTQSHRPAAVCACACAFCQKLFARYLTELADGQTSTRADTRAARVFVSKILSLENFARMCVTQSHVYALFDSSIKHACCCEQLTSHDTILLTDRRRHTFGISSTLHKSRSHAGIVNTRMYLCVRVYVYIRCTRTLVCCLMAQTVITIITPAVI